MRGLGVLLASVAACVAVSIQSAQPALAADSQTPADTDAVVIPHVFLYYQAHTLSCEETAVSMALTHQHIYVSQDIILREIGADRRPLQKDSMGRMRWGDPYRSFVGQVDGFEFKETGYEA